ncbi:MAG: ABC transporter permease [Bacteroidota bacterium]
MLKNYFKIAFRNFLRNKSFAATNLLGLTIGITSAILILLTVSYELTFDKFHENYDEIYQVIANRDYQNQIFTDRNMVLPLAKEIKEKLPQVKNATMTTYQNSYIFSVGDKKIRQVGYTVGESFFELFSWDFISGDARSAITDPSSIVLTQSAATTLFGQEDAIGKSIRINTDRAVKVSAIVADPPGNSSFQFEFIMPFNYSDPAIVSAMDEWYNSSWNAYIQVPAGTDMTALDQNITALKRERAPHDKISTYFTFPMEKWRLYNDFKEGKSIGGMIQYIRFFAMLGLFILLIACVNFMNLSTAQSKRRAKEIGIKKTLGSKRGQLVTQFYAEAMILVLFAFVFSILAVYLLLPSFNLLVDKQLTLPLGHPYFLLACLAIIVFTGVVAGSYPALYLSSFKALNTLKGTFRSAKKSSWPRRVLVVGQFVISILLISATIIIAQQIQHTKNRDLGYNPDNLIMIYGTDDTQRNFTAIKDELLKTGVVESVTKTSSPITNIWWRGSSPDWAGKPADLEIIFSNMNADVDFSSTFGIKMAEGRDFSGMPSDSAAIIFNQAAINAMGLENPVGMKMTFGGERTVIGVMEDVVIESPFSPVNPLILLYNPEGSHIINMRLTTSVQPQLALQDIETIFAKHNPNYPFEYEFIDQEFQEKFATEELISSIANIFAGLAIFICCLGLAGLVSYTVERRKREIGIRKVLGATVQQILGLVSKEFLGLVVAALILAVPLTWWIMHNWLDNFIYRIDIQWWVFALAGLAAIGIALLTVSFQSMKAALTNPVESLRNE